MKRWIFAAALLLPLPAFAQSAADIIEEARGPLVTLQQNPAHRAEADAALAALDKIVGKGGQPADVEGGLGLLRDAAGKGNSIAAMLLAALRADGVVGVPRDRVESTKWYRAVADSDRAPAMLRASSAFFVGRAYATGDGAPADDAEAARWYRRSAEGGNADGMGAYGLTLMAGRGVPKSFAEALPWLERAAERENAVGMAGLGTLYLYGEGVAKDEARARVLLEGAALKGQLTAARLAAALRLKATPPDFAGAFRFVEIAAQKHDPLSMGMLGAMYRQGQGVAKNLKLAAYWARQAAERGEVSAMLTLVYVFAESRGVEVTQDEATQWLDKAAAMENADALFLLASFHERGIAPFAKDRDKAIGYYRRAAAKGNNKAKEALARLGVTP